MARQINAGILNIPVLTSLRGIAAVLVMLLHFNGTVIHLRFSESSMFIQNCYLMVDLFFIISGFIMMHVYADNFSSQVTGSNYLIFLKSRFARIYPLHLFSLLVLMTVYYCSLNPYLSGELTKKILNPKAIPTHLLLAQSYGIHDILTWNIVSWSISAELFAYILFPFLCYALAKKKFYMLSFLCILAVVLYVSIVYYLPRQNFSWSTPNEQDINVSYEYGYIRGLAGFIAGMISYKLFQNKKLISYLSGDLFGLSCLIGIFFALNNQINDLIYPPLFMLLILSVADNKALLNKLLTLKPLQFLGKISYSFYMLHYILVLCLAIPAVDLLGYKYKGPGTVNPPLSTGLFICALFLIIVIMLSSISYDYIEQPFRKKINRIKIGE